jgi:hypothetical protein
MSVTFYLSCTVTVTGLTISRTTKGVKYEGYEEC